MKIPYETSFGEFLCVTGNIPELGSWKKFTCKLMWTEGHIWKTSSPIVTDVPHFQYKYVLLHKLDEPKAWENGLNRIADLRLLSDLKQQSGAEDFKTLELMDRWNQFCVKFSVMYPSLGYGEKIYIQGLSKDPAESMEMEESKEAYPYLNHKYGRLVKPYKLSFQFCPDEMTVTKGADLSKSIAVKYNYLKKSADGNS